MLKKTVAKVQGQNFISIFNHPERKRQRTLPQKALSNLPYCNTATPHTDKELFLFSPSEPVHAVTALSTHYCRDTAVRASSQGALQLF